MDGKSATFEGLDTDACRHHAAALSAQSDQLNGLISGIQNLLSSVTWTGQNAQRFMDNWQGNLHPQVRSAYETVTLKAQELRARAALQDQASAS